MNLDEIREYLAETAANGVKSGLNILEVERQLRIYALEMIEALSQPPSVPAAEAEPPATQSATVVVPPSAE